MFGVLSYEGILDLQTSRFLMSDEKGRKSSVRMIGILFARPESNLGAKEVVPSLGYFHVRSGKHIDFFCAGYGADDPRDPDKKSQVNVGDVGWKFNPNRFDAIRQEVEARSNWRHSGGTDLILTNARFDQNTNRAFLDLRETMVKCYLDEMIRIKAIPSVEEFFERIFRYAESATGDDPTWGFSDAEGLHTGTQSLLNLLLSLLPKNLGEELRRVAVFAASKGSA
jgi:hypothetical protein